MCRTRRSSKNLRGERGRAVRKRQRNEDPTIAVHHTTGHYLRSGIANWRDFVAMPMLVRSSVGVSPSVWEEAVCVMGERQAATVVTAIL
jgi:hypothetical protein